MDKWIYERGMEDVRRQGRIKKTNNVLTCVYCGMAYPEGTPPHGAKILTDHIKVCEKHPMKQVYDALVGLVGALEKDELEKMELIVRASEAPAADKVPILNAIHVLIDMS